MAARKSCTHLTWAEAKSKVGGSGSSSSSGGGSKGNTKKNNFQGKNVPHNQILAQKIIAKQSNNSSSNGGGKSNNNKDSISNDGTKMLGKKSLRKQQREDEKASIALAAIKEQRDYERRNRTIRPYDKAIERCNEISIELQSKWKYNTTTTATATIDNNSSTSINNEKDNYVDEKQIIVENIGMQLDEIMALEAIFGDTTEFGICKATKLEKLKELYESYVDNDEDETILQSLINHLSIEEGGGAGEGGAPISFTIQLNISDENGIIINNNYDNSSAAAGSSSDDDDDETMEKILDVAALVVLHVVLPPSYPNSTPPIISIHDCMVVNKNVKCSPDKPLETIAFVDKSKLSEAMSEEIVTILPYPCIYEVGVTWLTENIFNYMELRTTHSSMMGK